MSIIYLPDGPIVREPKQKQDENQPERSIGAPAPTGRSPYDEIGHYHEEWTYERER